MKRRTPVGDIVYEDLITDIYTEKRPKGSRLPTLQELCGQYGVGRNTARCSILRLEADHYVAGGRGKPYEVIFDYENPRYREQYVRHVLRRRTAILQVFETFEILMPDIVAHAIRLLPISRADVIRRLLDKLGAALQEGAAITDTLMDLYIELLSPLKNKLLKKLFAKMMSFIQIPVSQQEQQAEYYARSLQKLAKNLSVAIDAALSYDLSQIGGIVATLSQSTAATFEYQFAYMQKLFPDEPPSTLFTWNIDPRQDYLYSKTIMSLLYRITNSCTPGTLLPSYTELAAEYEVSEQTLRRAMTQLNQLKIVETVNGLGTKVRQFQIDLDIICAGASIRERLVQHLEALQLLALSSRCVVFHTLKNVEPDKILELADRMAASKRSPLEALLDFFYEGQALAPLAAIYQQFKTAMIWGAYLEFSQPQHDMMAAINLRAWNVMDCLKNGAAEKSAESLYLLYRFLFDVSKVKMEQLGIPIPLTLPEALV